MNLTATIGLHLDLLDTITTGPTVGQPYSVPYRPADLQFNYLTSIGTGNALYAAKFAFVKGTATAAVVDTDLTSVVCEDGTTGLTHVRELIVFNDDATNTLSLNLSVSNSFGVRFAAGTSVVVPIPPGSFFRMPAIPNAANGYVVDSTHKVVEVDPSTHTIAFRILALGD